MRKRLALWTAPTLGLIVVATPATSATAAATYYSSSYSVVDIAPSPEGSFAGVIEATSINRHDQVVGYSSALYSATSFRWEDGRLNSLGTPLAAKEINDRGRVAGDIIHRYTNRAFTQDDNVTEDLGYLYPYIIGGEVGVSVFVDLNENAQIAGDSVADANGKFHAFRWADGTMADLGTLGGAESRAAAINDHGEVVGRSNTSSGASHAFLWSDGRPGGHMIDLGTLGGTSSAATGINNRGQVVGTSTTASGSRHAFLWELGAMRDLGPVDGEKAIINERGQVLLGAAGRYGRPARAVLWECHHQTTIKGIGSELTVSVALNNRGQVVGGAPIAAGKIHGFIWENGVTTDLGTLGGPNSFATDVNDAGVAVGSADPESGKRHAVLWRRSDGHGPHGATD